MIVIVSGYSAGDEGTITNEGTTNSPTDYEIVSWDDFTYGNITDTSKYYSTIDYETDTNLDNNNCIIARYQ